MSSKTENKSIAIIPSEFDGEKVVITPIRVKNNKKTFYMNHGKDALYSETPWLFAPFGASPYDPNAQKQGGTASASDENRGLQWSLNLSASMMENESEERKKEVNHYFEQWKLVDEKMIQYGVDNYNELGLKKIKNAQITDAMIEQVYNRIVKDEPAEDGTQYPPRIQPKFMKKYDNNGKVQENQPNVTVYVARKNGDTMTTHEYTCETFDDLQKVVPRNSMVKCILQPKTYMVAQKYGVSLNIVQVLVKERTVQKLEGFSFSSGLDTNLPVRTEENHSKAEEEEEKEEKTQMDSDDEADADGDEEKVVETKEDVQSEEDEPAPKKKPGRGALLKGTRTTKK